MKLFHGAFIRYDTRFDFQLGLLTFSGIFCFGVLVVCPYTKFPQCFSSYFIDFPFQLKVWENIHMKIHGAKNLVKTTTPRGS